MQSRAMWSFLCFYILISHTNKRGFLLRHGTSHKLMRTNFISWKQYSIFHTENLGFLTSQCVHIVQTAAVSLGSGTGLFHYSPDPGGKMQETWPWGEIYSVIILALGTSWILTILQEREVGGATMRFHPQNCLGTWNHWRAPSLPGETTPNLAGTASVRQPFPNLSRSGQSLFPLARKQFPKPVLRRWGCHCQSHRIWNLWANMKMAPF